MAALESADIIALWEQGHQHPPTQRALMLLSHHYGSDQLDRIQNWPIGLRDHTLIRLFADTFSPTGEALATCPACEEKLVFQIDFQRMAPGSAEAEQPLTFTYEGESYAFRLPTSNDLLALAAAGEADAAPRFLAQSCIRESASDAHGNAEWSDAALSAFADAVERSDPFAEIWIALRCVGCDHTWREPFDIVDYFWRSLTQEAQNLLRQVDLLARTYGWSQKEILHLNATRRALYVEMIQS